MSKFVQYHAESVAFAKEFVKDIEDPLEKVNKLLKYISRVFSYDYIRALQIPKKNGMPDIDRCWRTKMGICFDISAMTVGMLRGIGIYAQLCIGKADGHNHAWVEYMINGKRYRYDHDGKAKVYKTQRTD